MKNYLTVRKISRLLRNGRSEELIFETGVNVILGKPNTGKTKWLQTLDYLFGDDKNPLSIPDDPQLTNKYQEASAQIAIGAEPITLTRRWTQPGMIGKIIVNDEPMPVKEFQRFLLEKLQIPLLHYPRGNPFSAQTWPELGFRSLLRHIYRRQSMWGDIADQRQDDEQHASLMQFLGLAENVFTPKYGELVRLKSESERLKARREQHASVLESLAIDLIDTPDMSVGITAGTVDAASNRLAEQIDTFGEQRLALISGALVDKFDPKNRSLIEELGERRATLSHTLETFSINGKRLADRLSEMQSYRQGLADERERMSRAEDAGMVLSDLKITHCPACDQTVEDKHSADGHCFLCHQLLPEQGLIDDLGTIRLKFERNRLEAELTGADDLVAVLEKDAAKVATQAAETREILRSVENKLTPARNAIAALVQERVSAIDVTLGELTERRRQLKRVKAALDAQEELTKQIAEIETAIEPLEKTVTRMRRAADYDHAASLLADGMTTYLNAIKALRPDVWPHVGVSLNLSASGFSFRIGAQNWSIALGGTDGLYFQMAYHYGLMTLSNKPSCHYPGLAVIDMPPEFGGEAVADTENFIVQPFVDLLAKPEYKGAQIIITGAAFDGLEGVHRQILKLVYAAT